jgi:hypothetical protein
MTNDKLSFFNQTCSHFSGKRENQKIADCHLRATQNLLLLNLLKMEGTEIALFVCASYTPEWKSYDEKELKTHCRDENKNLFYCYI